MFGTYIPPLTSLSGAANIPVSSRSTRVPEEVLTDAVMEEVKTRCCFVGSMLGSDPSASYEHGQGASASGVAASISADDSTEFDVPPSEVSHQPSESGVSSPQPPSSAFSGYTSTRTGTRGSGVPGSEAHLQGIATMYSRHSTATELKIRVDPPASQNTGTGKGTLLIPGWIRERAAEVLFEGGDVDESSVAEVILEALLKVCKGGASEPPTMPVSLIVCFTNRAGTCRSSADTSFIDLGCRWYSYASGIYSPTARRTRSGTDSTSFRVC